MRIYRVPVGLMEVNCYFIWNRKDAVVLIDPGADAVRISRELETNGLVPCVILLTHGHFDHIGAVAELKEKYGLEVIIGAKDEEMLTDPEKNASGLIGVKTASFQAERLVNDGEILTAGGLEFEAYHTPGHTKGSMTYRCEEALFTGDTLFAGSVGRTDFYGGDFSALSASLKRLAALWGDYRILPGHGPETTLETERKINPFLGADYDSLS